VAPHFLAALKKLGDHPLVGEASGVGLLGAVEIVADKAGRKSFPAEKTAAATIAKFAEDEGVIVRAMIGDRIAFCPPLVISEAEIDELFARFARALDRGLDWATREGLLAG
jgi:4-aminobutyrate--pyruvate transaminase